MAADWSRKSVVGLKWPLEAMIGPQESCNGKQKKQLICRHCQIKGLEDSNPFQKHSSYLTILPNNMGGGAMGKDYFLGLN